MTLTRAEGSPGAPWERPLAGAFEKLTVRSELLANNPLGDPALRPLYVYMPKAVTDSNGTFPSVYLIQGFTGQLDGWLGHAPFEPNTIERLDRMFEEGCPPAVCIFVDAWTSYGGSQFLNSVSTGLYMDYLCDEVVPFVDANYPTIAARDQRALTGKSSGGYGAMVVPMLRPDVFGAFATHAGDCLFETCYLKDFPATAKVLRDHFDGSYEVFFERFRGADRFDQRYHDALDAYAMAACYSPDESSPGKALLPFEVDTARMVPEVWERWLSWDPVRMAPKHLEALGSMRRIYVDAGKQDEYNLDLGAQAFSNVLTEAGIDHHFELFEGTHGGISYRYPLAIRDLLAFLG